MQCFLLPHSSTLSSVFLLLDPKFELLVVVCRVLHVSRGKGGALISCLLKTTQLRLVCLLPSDSSAFSLACFSRDCYYKRISLCTYNLFLFVMPKKFSFSIYFSSIQVSQGTSRHCEYHLPYLNYLRDIHI